MSLTSLNSLVETALSYSRKGWKVFPLPSGSKKPTLLQSWKNEATTNEDQIKSWWQQWPDANIGIVTGYESGIVVLDIDVKENVNGFNTLKDLEQRHGKLPPTLTAKTPSGGEHIFFKHPGGKIKTKAGVFEGLDSKGDSGFVVAVGSKGENGKLYEWMNSEEIAKIPEFWFNATYEGRIWEEFLEGELIGEGIRNNEMFRIGSSIRAKGAHDKDVELTLKEANQKRCRPKMSNKEVWSICKQVFKYEREEQNNVPEDNTPYTFGNQYNLIEKIKNSFQNKTISTGFTTLDDALGGGLFPGMYALGAITSLGKTTFALQVADYIASSGHDVLFYSLEMSNIEMLARSISRKTGNKTVRDVLSGRVQEDSLKQVLKDYPWKHIEIIEGNFATGVQEIRKRVERHCKELNRKPVVFVDYLQIVKPQDFRISDKQAVDRNVVELKRISRDYDIPFILVSSFNRDNYNSPVSFSALKETGSIEYACDVILGLQLSVINELEGTAQEKQQRLNEAKKENPRKVELVILKNRNGMPWATVPFKYFASVNRFEEIGVLSKQPTKQPETIETSDYIYVTSGEAFEPLAEELRNAKVVAIDTETTGLDPIQDKVRLIQFKAPGKSTVIADMFKMNTKGRQLVKDVLRAIQKTIYHNAKFDIKMLIESGLYEPGEQEIFDTMIADQLLTAGIKKKGFSLAELVKCYLNKELPKEQQKSDWSQDYLSQEQLQYASNDVAILLELHDILNEAIKSSGLEDVANLEFECVKAVARMELNGMLVSREKLEQMETELTKEKEIVIESLKETFGDINFNSTQQLKKALAEKGIKAASTERSMLKRLASKHPIIADILTYKHIEKMTQFTKKLPKHINPITGRIHASYNQMGADTGRFTCSSPNLQQIPREEAFRSCFIARPNHVLVIADYSQIELRAIAEIAEEKAMIQAFLENQDLHTLTASIISDKEKVTKEDRQSAKAVNFSLIYGAGATTLQKIARDNYGVSMTIDEAEKYRDRYFEAYKGIQDWHSNIRIASPQEIWTISGRKRLLEPNARVTTMYNTPIQGVCACILKRALCNLGLDIHVLSVVHDEIIVSAREENAHRTAEALKKAMIKAGEAYLKKVPVEVDVAISQSWYKP